MPNLRSTLVSALLSSTLLAQSPPPIPSHVTGFFDFSQQSKWDAAFLAVPDPVLAGQHLKILTSAPHWASSPEDLKTAEYVAQKFREAGLQTEIVPYKVLLNKPVRISIEAFDAHGSRLMSGPTPEHVDPSDHGGDPFQDDPRILPAFNGSSPSGDVTGEVVYANYGSLTDFKYLAEHGISVRDKIVLVRYGANFRGVKVYIAQKFGAKGVLIYSDPADDGYTKGDMYPAGPMRPESAVQRGSVQFLPLYPGDPETPGIASTPDLPDSMRLTPDQTRTMPGGDQPSIPANPLSYKDAAPILRALSGPVPPHDWQGGLPFTYHLGGAPSVTVHMDLTQDTRLRTIWDVTGTIAGSDASEKEGWVVAGNHRDAWVYGAVDPNSGTAAMLEAVHGLGELLKQGWKPKRTIVIASWDAEEEGLIGSTEWAEQHATQLSHAVAYFNTDVGVSGPSFNAAAVPSLKEFVREVTKEVPSPKGGSVYDQWRKDQAEGHGRRISAAFNVGRTDRPEGEAEVLVGDLGSGSDYTPFIQHLGVPSTDVGSDGPYGVYHSAFDNYNWFIKNADPTFVLEQQQARVFGLEILHMAGADVLPYDYHAYGEDIVHYLQTAAQQAKTAKLKLNFAAADDAAKHFSEAGTAVYAAESKRIRDPRLFNEALRNAESALLTPQGLPQRPWFKHTIFAPGEFTGYAAVVIPGVTEGIDAPDAVRAQAQLTVLAEALNRAATILKDASKQ